MSPRDWEAPIEEVREIRRRISAEHGHDPARLVEHYLEYQRRFADRLVSARGEAARKKKPAA